MSNSLEIKNDSVEAWLMKAKILEKIKDSPKAIEAYLKVIEIQEQQ